MYVCNQNKERTIIMRKTTLIFAFLAVVACSEAQDFLTPKSYGVWGRYGYDNFLFELLLVSQWGYEAELLPFISFRNGPPNFLLVHPLVLL